MNAWLLRMNQADTDNATHNNMIEPFTPMYPLTVAVSRKQMANLLICPQTYYRTLFTTTDGEYFSSNAWV